LIESALNQKIPTLGVCLGSQLLAEAAGGKVFPGHKKEIGWFHVELTHAGKKDKVFGGFPTRFEVFQWHGDTFRLPRHAVRLAQSQNYLNQAFRVGPCAWGLQFHMEMTASLIHSWLEQGKNEIRPLGGDHLRRSIVRRASGALPGMEKQAGQLLNNVFKVTRDMQQVTNNKE
jgi:GMP synthase-like glutamine amidotransferase